MAYRYPSSNLELYLDLVDDAVLLHSDGSPADPSIPGYGGTKNRSADEHMSRLRGRVAVRKHSRIFRKISGSGWRVSILGRWMMVIAGSQVFWGALGGTFSMSPFSPAGQLFVKVFDASVDLGILTNGNGQCLLTKLYILNNTN